MAPKRKQASATAATMQPQRLTRSQSRSNARAPAPPQPTPPPPAFLSTLVGYREIFFDRMVPLLTVGELVVVSEAIAIARIAQDLLHDTSRWRYVIQREGLLPSSENQPTATPEDFKQTVQCPHGSTELTNYLSLRSQLESFDNCVKVISGDLGQITHIGSIKVDCLVFPTSAALVNPGIGVSGTVHKRAGAELNEYVMHHRPDHAHLARRATAVTSVEATPGFRTGMNVLLHCIGPSGTSSYRELKLLETYTNVLTVVEERNDISCAAIASISTGNLGYPVEEAAEVAMEAVRRYLRSYGWPSKTLAFVCLDRDVLKAFQDAHAKTRASFFSGAVYAA